MRWAASRGGKSPFSILLSRLLEQAAKGQDFVITKAGKPMVRVLALDDIVTLEHLKAIRAELAEIKADTSDIKLRLHSVDTSVIELRRNDVH